MSTKKTGKEPASRQNKNPAAPSKDTESSKKPIEKQVPNKKEEPKKEAKSEPKQKVPVTKPTNNQIKPEEKPAKEEVKLSQEPLKEEQIISKNQENPENNDLKNDPNVLDKNANITNKIEEKPIEKNDIINEPVNKTDDKAKNEPKEESFKSFKLLTNFLTSAPQSIANKSQNDVKVFTNNYKTAVTNDIIEKNAQRPQTSKLLDFFTKSSPLIGQKISSDFEKFGTNIKSKSSFKNVFLMFFKMFIEPFTNSLSTGLYSLAEKVKTQANLEFSTTEKIKTHHEKKKMSIRFTGENISNLDENHKKYPKSPVKKKNNNSVYSMIKPTVVEEFEDDQQQQKPLNLSSIAAEEEKLKRLKEYKDIKEILKKQLQDLQGEIKNLKSTLSPLKGKDEILNDPLKPHLKKRILISDDYEAKKNAETLVSKLNKERKMKEIKKMKEIENIGKNIKGNIESVKKERIEIEKQLKFEKTNQHLNKIHEIKGKKEFLLKGNINPMELLNQYKNTSELNESLTKDKDKIKGSPDLLNKRKEELNKIRDLLKNK